MSEEKLEHVISHMKEKLCRLCELADAKDKELEQLKHNADRYVAWMKAEAKRKDNRIAYLEGVIKSIKEQTEESPETTAV